MNELILWILLSIVPIVELKGSIPLIVHYCIHNHIPYLSYVALAIALNIIIILILFLFLDFAHYKLMRINLYNQVWSEIVEKRLRKNIERIQLLQGLRKYFALFLFVFIPIPGTGVLSGTIIAWTLGMNRLKGFIAVAMGGLLSGVLILLATLKVLA